jgi:hypothetical protein
VSIGREIEAAHGALAPEQAAQVIYKNLFEVGPARLSDANKFTALVAISAGLHVWRKQLLDGQKNDAAEWKRKHDAVKAELDEAKLRLAICIKEHGG